MRPPVEVLARWRARALPRDPAARFAPFLRRLRGRSLLAAPIRVIIRPGMPEQQEAMFAKPRRWTYIGVELSLRPVWYIDEINFGIGGKTR